MTRPVRVRFAPSPTGPLHIGGVRTALFNYLFAKKHGGEFLLRIEDTDQTRYQAGAEEYIIEALAWSGLQVDEGVGAKDGGCGPYRQSERREIYVKYVNQLLAAGHAYYAFDTAEELEAKRKQGEEGKTPFVYSAVTRTEMNNSLTMDEVACQELLKANTPYVVRFKMPELPRDIEMDDEVRGRVVYNTADLDDKVLFKSDGLPTYHLANVVDDYLMNISHVIRGEEWLPSLPLHVLLYEALGWKKEMPVFSHLPLILKPQGKGKLSKRDGEKMGFPVFPLEWKDSKTGEVSKGFREEGYLQDAFVNMLAFLGWSPGTEQELFSKEELVEAFSLKRVGKSGAKFDPDKAKWFNQQYIKAMSNDLLAQELIKTLEKQGVNYQGLDVAYIVSLVKERASFIGELWEQASYFFVAPVVFDEKVAKKRWKSDTPAQIEELIALLEAIEDFSSIHTEERVKGWIADKGYNMGAIMNAFRLAIVGESRGPHLFDIIATIGQGETLKRLRYAVATLNPEQE